MSKIILFIDDEPDLLDIYQAMFEELYTIVCLTNPLDVIPYLKNNRVDLVISDINMPQKDGRVLMKEIKAQFPHVKSIGISACAATEETVQAFDGYIQKPLSSFSDLGNLISRLS